MSIVANLKLPELWAKSVHASQHTGRVSAQPTLPAQEYECFVLTTLRHSRWSHYILPYQGEILPENPLRV
jgi:hypothetical protein